MSIALADLEMPIFQGITSPIRAEDGLVRLEWAPMEHNWQVQPPVGELRGWGEQNKHKTKTN